MPADKRAYPSVWARPQRRERSALTREHIVAEAVRLLDEEGPDALTMRRLAARLGAGATSIYWHVANRDELLELVIDAIYGEVQPLPLDTQESWRTIISRFAHDVRATILRHPWLASMIDSLSDSYLGPNQRDLAEHLLTVFEGAGFDLRESDRAVNAVGGYVLGLAITEAAYTIKMARSGQTEAEMTEQLASSAEEIERTHHRLGALFAVYANEDPQAINDENFDAGLQRILDGFEARLDPAAGGTGSR